MDLFLQAELYRQLRVQSEQGVGQQMPMLGTHWGAGPLWGVLPALPRGDPAHQEVHRTQVGGDRVRVPWAGAVLPTKVAIHLVREGTLARSDVVVLERHQEEVILMTLMVLFSSIFLFICSSEGGSHTPRKGSSSSSSISITDIRALAPIGGVDVKACDELVRRAHLHREHGTNQTGIDPVG